MELGLFVDVGRYGKDTFQVFREIREPYWIQDAVLKLDYNYTPWPRHNGNLLWQ